jgi:hypothetical protein
MLVSKKNSRAQLQWFIGILTPRPHDNSNDQTAPADKGKGKLKRTVEDTPHTHAPKDSDPHDRTKRSKALPTPTDEAGPSRSRQVTADPTRKTSWPLHPASSARASHPGSRTSLIAPIPSASTVSSQPHSDGLLVTEKIDHSTHTAEEIVSHGYYKGFMDRSQWPWLRGQMEGLPCH